MPGRPPFRWLLAVAVVLAITTTGPVERQFGAHAASATEASAAEVLHDEGQRLFAAGEYSAASLRFWRAMTGGHPNPLQCYAQFMRCYEAQGVPEHGHLATAQAYMKQREFANARQQIAQALHLNPSTAEAFLLLTHLDELDPPDEAGDVADEQQRNLRLSLQVQTLQHAVELSNGTCVECLSKLGSAFFNVHMWDNATATFGQCAALVPDLAAFGDCDGFLREPAGIPLVHCLATYVYLKTTIMDWDRLPALMNALERALRCPAAQTVSFIQPHMTLHYDMDPKIKLHIARASALTSNVLRTRRFPAAVLNEPPPPLQAELLGRGTAAAAAGWKVAGTLEHRQTQAADATSAAPQQRLPAPPRLRIGFVSADFRLKATAYLVYDLYRRHDRHRIEVFCIATTPDSAGNVKDVVASSSSSSASSAPSAPSPSPSPHSADSSDPFEATRGDMEWRRRIADGCEHFVDVSGQPADEVAAYLRNKLRLHVAVDMDGYSNEGVRLDGIFLFRVAPVQVSFLVYIGTTGSPALSHVVGDRVAAPAELRGAYSEKFLLVPTSFFVNSHAMLMAPPGREPCKASRGDQSVVSPGRDTVNFCSFNKHLKISERTLDVWMSILARVPRGRLVLLLNPAESVPRVLALAAAHGLSPGRVVFLPFVASPFEHQARYACSCDVVLDTPVYNAHTGAVDALWGGVPLVTFLHSHHMGGRVARSILTGVTAGLGRPDWAAVGVASSWRDYEELAVRLGTNAVLRQAAAAMLSAACHATPPPPPPPPQASPPRPFAATPPGAVGPTHGVTAAERASGVEAVVDGCSGGDRGDGSGGGLDSSNGGEWDDDEWDDDEWEFESADAAGDPVSGSANACSGVPSAAGCTPSDAALDTEGVASLSAVESRVQPPAGAHPSSFWDTSQFAHHLDSAYLAALESSLVGRFHRTFHVAVAADADPGWRWVSGRGGAVGPHTPSVEAAAHARAAAARLAGLGLRPRPVAGDGNCFFLALVDQLRVHPGCCAECDFASPETVGGVQGMFPAAAAHARAAVVEHMAARRTAFDLGVPAAEFDRYLAHMRTPGSWAGAQEIAAAADLFAIALELTSVSGGGVWSELYQPLPQTQQAPPDGRADRTCGGGAGAGALKGDETPELPRVRLLLLDGHYWSTQPL